MIVHGYTTTDDNILPHTLFTFDHCGTCNDYSISLTLNFEGHLEEAHRQFELMKAQLPVRPLTDDEIDALNEIDQSDENC